MNTPPPKTGMGPVEDTCAEVAEFQGLYGSYHISEALLQKIWLRGEFAHERARLATGEALQVVHPGAWNRLGGPDFHDAELLIDGHRVTGDIEVHFRPEAWQQHQHDRDPAYDRVVLHVTLFPSRADAPEVRTRSGRVIPLLVLMELLWHDLEEYAADEAVAVLSGSDPWPLVEDLLARTSMERGRMILEAARRRWVEKVHFARVRVEKLGWDEACHLTALEVLGYRQNRAALVRVGMRYPFARWEKSSPALEELVGAAAPTWCLRGVRPANHPRVRLKQYLEWMRRVPDWPARLQSWRPPPGLEGPAPMPEQTSARRRAADLPRRRAEIASFAGGGTLAGARLDTWICNQALPFAAAAGASEAAAFCLWTMWYAGDFSDRLREAARQILPSHGGGALSNGFLQGLLGLQLARHGPGGGG